MRKFSSVPSWLCFCFLSNCNFYFSVTLSIRLRGHTLLERRKIYSITYLPYLEITIFRLPAIYYLMISDHHRFSHQKLFDFR